MNIILQNLQMPVINPTKASRSTICIGQVFYGTSLCGPTLFCPDGLSLQCAKFAMGQDVQLVPTFFPKKPHEKF